MSLFSKLRERLGLPVQIGLVEQVSFGISVNNSHLINQPLDAISAVLVGRNISFSYQFKDEASEWPNRFVYRVFQSHTYPYIAFTSAPGEFFVKRLDRIISISALDTGEVFNNFEEWFESAGIRFARRFERSPKSQPFV